MEVTQREAKVLESTSGKHIIKVLQLQTGHDKINQEKDHDCAYELLDLGLRQEVVEAILEKVSHSPSHNVTMSAVETYEKSNEKVFEDYLSLGVPQTEIEMRDKYLSVEDWPSHKSNVIVSAPLGSGKSQCVVDKAITLDDQRVLIICPRNEICNQYVQRFRDKGIEVSRYYGHFKELWNRVIITNFDRVHKVIKMDYFNWIVVDEFHALWEDSSFRRDQNVRVESSLLHALNCGSKIHLVSATPRRNEIELLTHHWNFHFHVFVSSSEPKPLVFYRAKDVTSAALLIAENTQERCVIYNNHIENNAKIAAHLSERGKRVILVHSNTRKYLNDVDKCDYLITTSFIDSGLSIDDGVLTKVVITSTRGGLTPILQKAARVRNGVEEVAVIVRSSSKSFRQEYPSQTWNGGWSKGLNEIPNGWDKLKGNRQDYVQRSQALLHESNESTLLSKVLNTPALIGLFNKKLSQRFGFCIASVCDLRVERFDLDMFIQEFRKIYNKSDHELLVFLLSALQIAVQSNEAPQAVKCLYQYYQSQDKIDHSLVNQIVQCLLEKFRDRIIIADAQRELIRFCIEVGASYSIPKDVLESANIPESIEEWFDLQPYQRRLAARRAEYLLIALAQVVEPGGGRPVNMDPMSLNVGLILNRWIPEVERSLQVEYLSAEIEKFVDQFIGCGYIPLTDKICGNLTPIERSRLYNGVKKSCLWFCHREKRGRKFVYVIDRDRLIKFQKLAEELRSIRREKLPVMLRQCKEYLFYYPLLQVVRGCYHENKCCI
jgi:hypothetical protein